MIGDKSQFSFLLGCETCSSRSKGKELNNTVSRSCNKLINILQVLTTVKLDINILLNLIRTLCNEALC